MNKMARGICRARSALRRRFRESRFNRGSSVGRGAPAQLPSGRLRNARDGHVEGAARTIRRRYAVFGARLHRGSSAQIWRKLNIPSPGPSAFRCAFPQGAGKMQRGPRETSPGYQTPLLYRYGPLLGLTRSKYSGQHNGFDAAQGPSTRTSCGPSGSQRGGGDRRPVGPL